MIYMVRVVKLILRVLKPDRFAQVWFGQYRWSWTFTGPKERYKTALSGLSNMVSELGLVCGGRCISIPHQLRTRFQHDIYIVGLPKPIQYVLKLNRSARF